MRNDSKGIDEYTSRDVETAYYSSSQNTLRVSAITMLQLKLLEDIDEHSPRYYDEQKTSTCTPSPFANRVHHPPEFASPRCPRILGYSGHA